MQGEHQVRRATLNDARWIVDLSARVQAALTAAGSLQQIGPLPLAMVEMSIRDGRAYLLEIAGRSIGSVLVDPLDGIYPYTQTIDYVRWGVHTLPAPLWYLHALMLDPAEQGNGLGLTFLEGVKQLALPPYGTIILDCWAGNTKLRAFYQRAGFTHRGDFPVKDYKISVFSYTTPINFSHDSQSVQT
jgi:GNAT superfamily N-acetyltransferase